MNPMMNYDFTLKAEGVSHETLIEKFKSLCREYCFQLEKGETGYIHYQGRIKLKAKARINTIYNKLKIENIHLSPTSSANIGNNFYVTKDETRIEGPWCSDDIIIKLPWDIALIKELKPWQNSLLDISKKRILREVYVIIDKFGGIGKSTFTRWMCIHGHARAIPFANDNKDICRIVMDMPESNCYIFDMPRALKKDKLQSLFAGIEMIKGGYAYDDRYKYAERWFDPPVIFVFTNMEPDREMLSPDRWVICSVTNDELEIKGR